MNAGHRETIVSARGENMRINGDRLWDSLMDMAKIGPGIAGGNNRQTLPIPTMKAATSSSSGAMPPA